MPKNCWGETLHTSIYGSKLWHNICSDRSDLGAHKTMRRNQNSIITICIPTFNRGSLLLKNLEEIMPELTKDWPLLIVDNGSTTNKSSYKQIEKIANQNPLIKYVRQPWNKEFIGNMITAIELVDTNFIFFLADEDLPNFDFLKNQYESLKCDPNLGAIRTSTMSVDEKSVENLGGTFDDETLDPGLDAVVNFAMQGNYLSGQIFNAELIKSSGILEALKTNKLSQKYYPHMYLNMKLAAKFKTKFSSEISAIIGLPCEDINDGSFNSVNGYFGSFSYGNRIDQFVAFRDALLECVEDINGEIDVSDLYLAYLSIFHKYMQMILLSNGVQYVKHGINIKLLARTFSQFALSAANAFPLFHQVKDELSNSIMDIEEAFLSKARELYLV